MRNKIEDLRNHLFEAIEMVKDGKMDVQRARTVSELAGRITDTAKVEVEYMREVRGAAATGFMPLEEKPKADESSKVLPMGNERPRLVENG